MPKRSDVGWMYIVIVGQIVMLIGYAWGMRFSMGADADIITPSIMVGAGFVISAIGCTWRSRRRRES